MRAGLSEPPVARCRPRGAVLRQDPKHAGKAGPEGRTAGLGLRTGPRGRAEDAPIGPVSKRPRQGREPEDRTAGSCRRRSARPGARTHPGNRAERRPGEAGPKDAPNTPQQTAPQDARQGRVDDARREPRRRHPSKPSPTTPRQGQARRRADDTPSKPSPNTPQQTAQTEPEDAPARPDSKPRRRRSGQGPTRSQPVPDVSQLTVDGSGSRQPRGSTNVVFTGRGRTMAKQRCAVGRPDSLEIVGNPVCPPVPATGRRQVRWPSDPRQ